MDAKGIKCTHKIILLIQITTVQKYDIMLQMELQLSKVLTLSGSLDVPYYTTTKFLAVEILWTYFKSARNLENSLKLIFGWAPGYINPISGKLDGLG